ncbi:MAG: right-handed parallel beta-helix repeat-containing protein, partial [Chloroflexota bacterium]
SHIISTTGSSNSAISLSSSHGSQIRRSTIQHSATAISLSSSHDVVIEDNTIERNSTGISLVASHRFVINRNRITHNIGSGLTTNYWSSSSNGIITANIIAENGGTGLFINGSGQQIDNNMIVANNGYGVDWRAGNGFMHHNTIANNDGDAGLYVQFSARVALTNTIISGHTYGIRTASTSGYVQANHTLWFSNTDNTAASGGLNISTTHDVHGNPMFVGTGETWDAYHLTPASPAIDAGIATSIHTDIDGQGRAPDIGADEYPHVLTLNDGQSETTTPNSTVTYVHTLRNSGGVTDTVNLSANSSQNWSVSVAPTQVTLGVGMTTPVTVTLLVPVDASGQTDVTQVTAQSTLDINAHHTITNVTGIGAGLSLTPNHNASLPAEGTIVYAHVLTNKGTAADTINLSLNSSQGWASIVSDNPVVLDAGASITAQVQANVPLAAAAGVVDATTLTAVSTNANQVTASAHNETTATATPGTRYISTTGNDMGNSCLDRAYPCLTLEHAHQQAQSGDHIKMAGGLYTNPDIAVEGRFVTLNRNLTLSGGYDGNEWTTANPLMSPTILDGEHQGVGLYMQTGGITVTVQGLTIQRARGQGIYASNTRVIIDNSQIISMTGSSNSAISLSSSHGSQIRRSTIQHSATAISLSSSHDVVIEDSTIEQNSTGISLFTSHRFLINRNRITHNTGNGLTTNYWSSSSNGTITANTIAENGGTGLFINGSGQQIDNNMIVVNDANGISWRTGSGIMRHNTIADNNGQAGLSIESASVVLTNTIIAGHTYGIHTVYGGANVQADHTLWHNNSEGNTYAESGTISTTNNFTSTPGFIGGEDAWTAYHLAPTSVAIDAGVATGVVSDIDGNSRPYDAGYDLGADEYPGTAITLNGVTVSGPATGMVQEPVFLTATVRPLTATLPITYVWTASGGVAPIRQVDTLENEVALVWHTLGTQIVTTTATNEAGTTVDTHTVELLPPPTAAFPFYDGFETGELAPEWRIFSGPQGRVRIDNSHAQEGRWSVLLDNAVSDDTLDYASLLLTINLSGQTNPVLSFWWKTFGDENHPQDGVFISDDYGKTWHQAFSLNYGSASYQQSFVDLGTVAQQYGLTLHDHVQLKFQFYDDRPIPGDGYAIDEVRVMPAQPLNTVQLTGPASGMAQSGLSFVASVRPETTTPPITYRWQASGQAEQVQVDNLSNEATFIWDEAGPKMVTVVVSNSLGTATDTFTVDVTPYVPETFADLRVQEFTAPATGRTDDTVTVAWRVQNQGGNETNVATWRDRIYLSPDASLDPDTDLALATQTHTGIIAADADYLASATVVMPEVTTGEYYLFVVTDVDNVVNENQNENNNQSTPALPIYLESGPPDLQLAMSAIAPSNSGMSSNYALAGSVITYTLTVANNGLQVAEDVTLNIVLPAGTTLHSQSSGGSFSQADNVLTWQLGVLQPDEETMVQVAATIDAAMAGDGAAVITNRAEVVTSSPEENIDDNVATVNTTVEQPVARFSATPTTPFIAVTAGHSAQYTVTLKNTGAAATGELQLTPPPHISWVTVAPATLPSLAAGATTHVIITASPPADLRSGYYRDLLSISRANAQPTLIGLTVEVSGERQPLHIHVQNDQGAAVAGASVQLTKQQPWLGVTEGVTTERAERVTATSDSNGMAVFDDIEVGAYTYLAIASAHENANGTVEVLGGQPSDVPQEVIINMTSQAILHVRPNTPIIGVVQGDTQNQVITIINNGAAPLTGIQITPPASIPWVYLGVPDPVPTLAVGEEMAFTIYANAAKDQATNIYQDYLTVSAANGDSRQIALTVEVTDQVVRDVEIQVADTVNQPIANGSVTLIQQEPTSQIIGEQETTFNQHYSEQIDAEGMVQFTALAPGDYNYVIRADGYDQGTGVLEVMAGTGQQRETVLLDPAPFDATWEVVPLDGQYAITLTLTYDTGSNETPPPVVFIPERKWWFSTCHPQVFDIIEIFNPSPIAVNLSDLFFDVEGVEVTPAVFPQGIPPFDSIRVPVTATHIGDLEQENGVMLPFSYEAVPDELVTFTFNPSSATSPVLNTGETFAQTYLLEPVEFVPDVQYTVEFASPNQFSWIQVTSALGAGAWTEATAIAFNLAVTPPATLADGVYNDEIHVRVTGNDGAIREGTLKIDVTKTGDRFQVHTHFELGPIPYHLHLDRTYSTIETGYHEIEPVDCETIGENPPEDKFVWSIIVDRGLIGHFSGPGVIAPNLPTYVTPPVIGYDHQQVRLEISQELLLEGEGFRANLTMDNTSDAPIEVVEIDIRVADLDGTDQTTGFTFIPETPTALGTVDVGGHVAGEWLILPDNLNVTSPDGQNYQVSAVIHYTWGGIRTSVETVPRQITVYPAPELVITYELPLSEQNCTNFRVKTTISNQGIGIARGLRFRSTQPSIIDNQSQLLIGFEIVATLVNSVPQGASFDLSLGDVSPGDTVEITWQLQASLPGRFVGFSSDFQQSNYQGQLLPPLIREINTVFVPTDPVNGNCASVQNLRSNPPLLIVHGIQTFDMGGEGFVCRDEPVEFTGFNSTIGNDLPRWLTENYNVWLAHLEAVPLRSSRPDYDAWGNLPPIATNARCLEKQVEYLYKLTGRKLTMVAHSMGGLVSRACLSSAHTEILGFTFGSRGCRDKVRALYTMGSPHGGINTISHLKLLAAERKWTSSLADQLCDAQAPLCEMSSENMWHFNRRYLNDPNVNYTFIGGDHTPLIRYDLWIKEYDIGPIIEELDGKHDGIVGRYSAVGWKAGETGFDPPAWPQASPPTQYWTDEVHFTEFGGGNSYYDARGESLELSQSYGCIAHREYKLNEIERHLHPESPIDAIYEQRPETCRPVDSNIQLRNVDSNMATQTPSQEQAIPFQTINSSSGALIAGQSISYTVMMDNEGE